MPDSKYPPDDLRSELHIPFAFLGGMLLQDYARYAKLRENDQ